MPGTLLLMRHAKSSWDSDAASDFDRPLAKRGKKDASAMGHVLRERALVPDRVVASGAKRARKTARRVLAAMGLDRARLVIDERLYEATLATLRSVIDSHEVETLLIVGHNPDLESLLRDLVRDVPESRDGKLLPTSAIAHLELSRRVSVGPARLVEILRPRDPPSGELR